MWLKWTGATLLALLLFLAAWGFLIEPRLIDTNVERGTIPGLPDAWVGRRIAVVADYQVGMWGANLGTMRRITARLVEESPAAVLLAGDFVYRADEDPSHEIATVVEIVRPLAAAGIPTFAVLGNHDYGLFKKDDRRDERLAARVRAALESAGVRVLQNQAAALKAPPAMFGSAPAALYVVGIGSKWAGESHPEEALREVPPGAPRIVFMHNPDSFAGIPAGAAPLAVAGHTHGGQITIPGFPHWSWLNMAVRGEAHADGWIEEGYGDPGNRLYVNRGIGFSSVPVRINTMPEITYFELARTPGTPATGGERMMPPNRGWAKPE